MIGQFSKLTIFNSSALTDFGSFEYRQIVPEEARAILSAFQGKGGTFRSAIGHEGTAKILSRILGVNIPYNRISFSQEAGEVVLVFKLKGRVGEGVVLTDEQIERVGYEFGLLTKTA